MKKLILTVLCLCLASCGTFDVKVQILPTTTAIAPIVATVPATHVAIQPTATAMPTPAPTPTAADPNITVNNIQMNDDIQGWAVTSTGRIVITRNGGSIWHDVTPSQETFAPQSLFALSDKTAWVVPAQIETDNTVVWRTSDGGIRWKASQPMPLVDGTQSIISLQFTDEQHGWLLLLVQDSAPLLYQSTDGGENWQRNNMHEYLAQAYLPANAPLAFVDGQHGWLGGAWEQAEWRTLKTGDGGETWGTDTFRLPQQKNIQCNGQAVPAIPPGSMAVEVQCTIAKDPKYLFHHVYYLSKSTGTEWRSWALSGKLISIQFLNLNLGWMMVTSDQSQLNKILQTRDGGKTWKTVSIVEWKQARLNFVTDKTGWAIVSNNIGTVLFKTEDSGKTWVQVRPFVSP